MPTIPLPLSLTLWLETLVPGIIGGILAYPILPLWAKLESGGSGIAGFVSLSLIIGLVTHLLRLPLGEFAMGRYWIPGVRNWFVRRIQAAADRITKEAQKQISGDMPSPSTFQNLLWSARFLEALVAGPGGKRIAYCPTIVGNAYLALAFDLYQAAEVVEMLRGNPAAAWVARTTYLRAWYLLPQELRTQLVEAGAVSVALLRISVIAGLLSVVYVARFALSGGNLAFNLLMALAVAIASRVTYVAGFDETISLLETTRGLFMSLDRDTVQAIKDHLRAQTHRPPPAR